MENNTDKGIEITKKISKPAEGTTKKIVKVTTNK